MIYLFKLLLILINIDQETILNWFGIKDPNRDVYFSDFSGVTDIEPSTDVSLETIRLVLQGLWEKVQAGLSLNDVENIIFFILFIRFLILAIRYNLKTSFYITGIGLLAGYLWYRHLIDLISSYRNILLKLPFLRQLGVDATRIRSIHRYTILTNLKLRDNVPWYNPGKVLYYAFTKGIIHEEPGTGLRYYIDPISMIISNLEEPLKSKIDPIYYYIYNTLIPKVYKICTRFWSQLSGIAAYAILTRVGKRYCPYLVRWHWTFLLLLNIPEQIVRSLMYRIYYFQTIVLIPQSETVIVPERVNELTGVYVEPIVRQNPEIVLQIQFLNSVLASIAILHIGFIIFGLLHAICGQYFYMPFFVENTELHIGLRPKDSIYSGGYTSWQDREEKEKNFNRVLPKLWYGWFGRGTKNNWQLGKRFKKLLKKIVKKVKKQLKK